MWAADGHQAGMSMATGRNVVGALKHREAVQQLWLGQMGFPETTDLLACFILVTFPELDPSPKGYTKALKYSQVV